MFGQLVRLGPQLLGRGVGLFAGSGTGRWVGHLGRGGMMHGVDTGFGHRPGDRGGSGILTIAGLGGRHVD